MSSSAPLTVEELDRKIARVFAGKVVRKELVRKVKFGSTVPVYVLEYLLGKYCLLVPTIGLEPAGMDRRLKMLFLLRLVPLAEQNYN